METMVESMSTEELRELVIRIMRRQKGIPQGKEMKPLYSIGDKELLLKLNSLGLIVTEEELIGLLRSATNIDYQDASQIARLYTSLTS